VKEKMEEGPTIERLIEVLGPPEEDSTTLVPVAGSKSHVPARFVKWSCGCTALQAARMYRAAFGDGVRYEPCSDDHDHSVMK